MAHEEDAVEDGERMGDGIFIGKLYVCTYHLAGLALLLGTAKKRVLPPCRKLGAITNAPSSFLTIVLQNSRLSLFLIASLALVNAVLELVRIAFYDRIVVSTRADSRD